ncbi:MAG: hypothetical protein JSW48_16715 [Betaproteobacteria bacterium]|jgi:hypothetical protein|nr:MAG: hypothetical protein JSW48_16715 [Betaproteobacteria bacterium]
MTRSIGTKLEETDVTLSRYGEGMIETQSTDELEQAGIDCRFPMVNHSTAPRTPVAAWPMWLLIDLPQCGPEE